MTPKPEHHEIGGTTFRFPALPPRDELDPELFRKLTNKRKGILAKALNPRDPSRNTGSVRSVLGKLAGTRNPEVKRPDSMRGEIVIDDRVYHWWAAAPIRGEHWCVDVELRTYVMIAEPSKHHETARLVAAFGVTA